MAQYKDHPIYGIGVLGAEKEWHCRGLIFDAGDKVSEIKKFDHAVLTFESEEKAKAHALQLCKSWIDEQSVAVAAKARAEPVAE